MASETVQDTLKKVDQAMVRLQEMQCTIVGGSKACGGVNLSPRSTRGYLRTSLRCKEESLRLKELAMKEVEETNPDKGQQFGRVSSLRRSSSIGEASRRWSMPAVLIQQAVGEIMEASNFAKEVAYLVSHSDQNELTESPNIPRISNGKTMTGMQQQQNSDFKHVPDAIETQDLDIGGTNGLQKFWSNRPDNKVHKFRVITKDVSSSLKCFRDAEKQERPARVGPELSELGVKARSKTSFQVFNRVDRAEEQRRMDKLILSAPCCSPPAKAINEKTSSANTRVKVEQIRPPQKGCLSRYTSTNAIMFPNPAFVSSPSKNTQRDRSTDACILRRKSMPSLNDLTSSKTTASSPFYKENELGDCMKDSSKNLKKSSSFSEAYRHTAAKLIKQSHIPSLLRKALKKFHVTKASPASVASGHSPIHNMKTEPGSNPRLAKSESLRIFPSSQMQGCLDRKNSMSSYDRSALKNFHVTKASPASVASGHSPIHNMKTEPGSNPRLAKSESLRIFPSSQMQGCLDRKNSMSSYDRSTLKKFHVTKASPASVASGHSPIHNMKTEHGSNPRLAKSESLRIFPSSQMQGCLDRRNSMSSNDRSALKKFQVTRASPASVASGRSPIHNMKTEPGSNPRLAKSESLRIFPSSQMQGCLDRRNSMSSYDRSALKKFHVTKASPALVASGHSQIHNMKTEPGSNPRFAKSESVRIFPSSQVQGCVDRRNSMSSYDRSASSKISPLSKKPIESLVQPITPGWLPRKRSSNLMHSQADTMGEEVANKIIVTEETEVGEGQINYMHYERGQIEASLPFENFVSKQGVSPVEDYSLRSSTQTIANSSSNNTLYPSDVQEYDNYLGCSEQGFLRPVDTNCGLHRFVRSESNMDASKEKLNKKKSTSQRKENRDVNREDAAGETKQITKNSSRFLGRSWSFRHEKLNNSTVWQPFFKNAKDWMKSQRSPSSVNR